MVEHDIQFREISEADGGFLCDLSRNRIVPLNGTGAYVWRQLREDRSPHEVVISLAEATGSEVTAVHRDVTAFIDDLRAKDLLPRCLGRLP